MNRPALVMVHGLVGSPDYFEPARRIHNADVFCCDLLGYGAHRDAPAETLTLAAQAAHAVEYAERLRRGPVWLLGHSMGGAIVMLAEDRRPDLVAGIINVEGNFTLKDAFWSSRIIRRSAAEWAAEYNAMLADVPATLRQWGIEPTPERVGWMSRLLRNQPAETVYAMSKALVAETQPPEYLEAVQRVVKRGRPLHLIAGEKSAEAWDVPEFVRRGATSYTEQPNVGHFMMLEEPDAFCHVVEGILVAA
jgi:pimeloyl-ACP methyl ester carboxylesterase